MVVASATAALSAGAIGTLALVIDVAGFDSTLDVADEVDVAHEVDVAEGDACPADVVIEGERVAGPEGGSHGFDVIEGVVVAASVEGAPIAPSLDGNPTNRPSHAASRR